jgi:DNA-binding helix-hairpin-helix protein with protein kinase domain
MQHAHVLRALAKKSVVREATKTHDYREKFANAIEWGDLPAANGHLLAALKDSKSDHAMQAACAKALIEIAQFVGTDTGEDFNGAWLAKLADLPLRTAQDLIQSANALESGFETLLIDTEHGARKAFRKMSAMTPTKRREAMTALKECLTLHLLEFAAKREKATRTRNVSLSELKALSAIGLNNPEGWTALTEQSPKDGKRWLAATLDKVEAAERRHGDDAEPRGCDARVNGRRVLPSITMQRLANERIYSL